MDKTTIIAILIERGYKSSNARRVAEDLQHLSAPLDVMFRKWVDSGETRDFAAHGYAVSAFVNDWKMKYPAALLTMDWLLKEPETAINELKRGIR